MQSSLPQCDLLYRIRPVRRRSLGSRIACSVVERDRVMKPRESYWTGAFFSRDRTVRVKARFGTFRLLPHKPAVTVVKFGREVFTQRRRAGRGFRPISLRALRL